MDFIEKKKKMQNLPPADVREAIENSSLRAWKAPKPSTVTRLWIEVDKMGSSPIHRLAFINEHLLPYLIDIIPDEMMRVLNPERKLIVPPMCTTLQQAVHALAIVGGQCTAETNVITFVRDTVSEIKAANAAHARSEGREDSPPPMDPRPTTVASLGDSAKNTKERDETSVQPQSNDPELLTLLKTMQAQIAELSRERSENGGADSKSAGVERVRAKFRPFKLVVTQPVLWDEVFYGGAGTLEDLVKELELRYVQCDVLASRRGLRGMNSTLIELLTYFIQDRVDISCEEDPQFSNDGPERKVIEKLESNLVWGECGEDAAVEFLESLEDQSALDTEFVGAWKAAKRKQVGKKPKPKKGAKAKGGKAGDSSSSDDEDTKAPSRPATPRGAKPGGKGPKPGGKEAAKKDSAKQGDWPKVDGTILDSMTPEQKQAVLAMRREFGKLM